MKESMPQRQKAARDDSASLAAYRETPFAIDQAHCPLALIASASGETNFIECAVYRELDGTNGKTADADATGDYSCATFYVLKVSNVPNERAVTCFVC